MSASSAYNPYEPLQETFISADLSPLESWRQVVRKFRRESDALAGVAFFFAACAGIVASVILRGSPEITIIVAVGPGYLMTMTLFVAGVQIAMKKMIGVRILMFPVYTFLMMALFAVAAAVASVGAFGFLFVSPVVIILGILAAQCHRVLRNAKRLVSSGIPLHTKPHELETEYFRQLFHNPAPVSEIGGPLTRTKGDHVD